MTASERRGVRKRREADESRVEPSLEDRTREGLLHNNERVRLIGLDRADPSLLVVSVELVQPYHESIMCKAYFLLVFFTVFFFIYFFKKDSSLTKASTWQISSTIRFSSLSFLFSRLGLHRRSNPPSPEPLSPGSVASQS